MNTALLRKYVVEAAMLFVMCAIGVFSFCWFRTWIVGELDTAQFKQIIDLLPHDWRKFATVDFDWLVSYLGRTALTLDEPMLVMFVSAWVLVRGSDVVSGELSRGTMEMLLAQPVSRRQVYWTHARYTIVGLFLLCLITWAGMSLGIWTTSVDESTYPEFRVPLVDIRIPLTFLKPKVETVAMVTEVNPLMFLPGVINLFFVGFFLAGFAAWCSSWDRYRWRTLGIVAAFYFLGAMLKILGMAVERYHWTIYCSFFGYYDPAAAVELCQSQPGALGWLGQYGPAGKLIGIGPLGDNLLLLGVGVVLFLWGARIFAKRDLPAPV
jgi:ABC-2 type transport system permease protein